MKDRLIDLVIEKAFSYSEEPAFKLVSGRMSNYYFNCKAVTLNPEGIYVVGNLLYDMVKDERSTFRRIPRIASRTISRHIRPLSFNCRGPLPHPDAQCSLAPRSGPYLG